MNSYQLTSKLRKVRADTYLTATDQALYHELVAICNDKGWRETFEVKNIQLCFNLNITEKTLIKSRQLLCDAGLIYFKSCKDKRIGCCYSFLPVLSTGNITVDNTGDITAEGGTVTEPINIFSPRLSTLLLAGIFPDETPIPPYKRIQTINRESLAHTHESPPPEKPKKSKKEEGDSKPLVYPFSSIAFMSAWETLRQTPKWKKKLNYALQLSLDKLSKFEEEFAIRQIERAIESNWTGVVFTGTERDYQEWLNLKHGNNRKSDQSSECAVKVRTVKL